VIQGVSDIVGAEMDAFVEAGMPPAEYHWIERLVYERWRGPLRRAGTYPLAIRAAAAESELLDLPPRRSRPWLGSPSASYQYGFRSERASPLRMTGPSSKIR
jgi:hypothetical protein